MAEDRRALPPLSAAQTQDWTLRVDGQKTPCRSARLESVFGTWSYGAHPHGYDGWWFAEEGGGGAITLPFFVDGDEVWVGLIEEDRPNMGGVSLCGIGGYLDADESHRDAAAREAFEETQLGADGLEALPGLPVVSNRAMFVADPKCGQGVHLFALRVERSALTPSEDGARLIWQTTFGAEASAVVFLPWQKAAAVCADALALSAIVRLLAWLDEGAV